VGFVLTTHFELLILKLSLYLRLFSRSFKYRIYEGLKDFRKLSKLALGPLRHKLQSLDSLHCHALTCSSIDHLDPLYEFGIELLRFSQISSFEFLTGHHSQQVGDDGIEPPRVQIPPGRSSSLEFLRAWGRRTNGEGDHRCWI